MISRPNLGCSHWLEFVYVPVIGSRTQRHFLNVSDFNEKESTLCKWVVLVNELIVSSTQCMLQYRTLLVTWNLTSFSTGVYCFRMISVRIQFDNTRFMHRYFISVGGTTLPPRTTLPPWTTFGPTSGPARRSTRGPKPPTSGPTTLGPSTSQPVTGRTGATVWPTGRGGNGQRTTVWPTGRGGNGQRTTVWPTGRGGNGHGTTVWPTGRGGNGYGTTVWPAWRGVTGSGVTTRKSWGTTRRSWGTTRRNPAPSSTPRGREETFSRG